MDSSAKNQQSILIMMRGLPGSGKSTIAQALQQNLGQDTTVVLDPDTIDFDSHDYQSLSASLIEEAVDIKLHPYRYLRARAYRSISAKKIVIWNQAFTNADLLDRTIKNLIAYAEERGQELPVLVVEVSIDPVVAKSRIAERVASGGHDVDNESLDRFVKGFENFTEHNYKMVTLNGTDSVDLNVEKIIKETTILTCV